MATVERKLKEMNIEYVKNRVEEDGVYVDQLFFHDPDGSMIEICNCDVLPVVPLVADAMPAMPIASSCTCSSVNCHFQQQHHQIQQQQQSVTRCSSIHMMNNEDFLHCV